MNFCLITVLLRVTLVDTLFAPLIVSMKVSTIDELPLGHEQLTMAVLPTDTHVQPVRVLCPALQTGAAGIS